MGALNPTVLSRCAYHQSWYLVVNVFWGQSLRGGFLREDPLRGGFLRETPLTTGKLTGSYGGTFCPLRDLSPLQGPLRADRLTGRPLTGRLLTRRPLTNYRKAYGKLRGGTLPELGENFRLCAVDQKRSFFLGLCCFWTFCPFRDVSLLQGPLRANRLTGRSLTGRLLTRRPLTFTGNYGEGLCQNWARFCAVPRVVPFLDLLPFKGPFPLTGALTGRPPYGKVPYGQTALQEGLLRGGFLREGPPRITGKLTGSYGEGLYQNWVGISACAP